MKKKLPIILLLLIIIACGKKEEPILMVYEIEPQFLPYITLFIQEAEKANVVVKAENLRMTFKTENISICGNFIQDKTGQRNIIINARCWKISSQQNREALVFHELGHCFLNREHRDDLMPSQDPVSIMNTYNNGPYEPCNYAIDGDTRCNKTERRSYYINELFNDKTPLPYWGLR